MTNREFRNNILWRTIRNLSFVCTLLIFLFFSSITYLDGQFALPGQSKSEVADGTQCDDLPPNVLTEALRGTVFCMPLESICDSSTQSCPTIGCDPKTQSCPTVESPCIPTDASCNPSPCDSNTSTCECLDLDKAINDWITRPFVLKINDLYGNAITDVPPVIKDLKTWKTPSNGGELNRDYTFETASNPDKKVKLRIQFAPPVDNEIKVVATLIDYLGPQPIISWQWIGSLQNIDGSCSVYNLK